MDQFGVTVHRAEYGLQVYRCAVPASRQTTLEKPRSPRGPIAHVAVNEKHCGPVRLPQDLGFVEAGAPRLIDVEDLERTPRFAEPHLDQRQRAEARDRPAVDNGTRDELD